MKKTILYPVCIAIAVMLVGILSLMGCKTAETAETTAAETVAETTAAAETEAETTTAAEPYDITLLIRMTQMDFFQAIIQVTEEIAKELGVNLTVLSAELDADLQLSQVDTVIEKGADGVILLAQDSAGIVPGVKKLNDAGIPVIGIDVEPAGGDLLLFIAFSSVKGGEAAAHSLIDILKEKYNGEVPTGVVLNISGDPIHATALLRTEGMMNVMKDYPTLEVVDVTAKWSDDESFKVTTDLMQRYGDKVVGILTGCDCMVQGIDRALELGGWFKPKDDPGHIPVSSINGQPGGMKLLKAGRIDAISIQPSDVYGSLALKYLVDYLNGKEIPKVGDTVTEEGTIWSPAEVVQHEAGYPNMMLNSLRVGIDVPIDSPLIWGNRFELE